MERLQKAEVLLEPIKHEFLSDERIAELFPRPTLAEHVRAIRDAFRIRYEQWQIDTYGNTPRSRK